MRLMTACNGRQTQQQAHLRASPAQVFDLSSRRRFCPPNPHNTVEALSYYYICSHASGDEGYRGGKQGGVREDVLASNGPSDSAAHISRSNTCTGH